MATNPPPAPQGVTGNTPSQLNAAAGTAASFARGLSHRNRFKWLGYIAVTIFLITMVIVYTSNSVQFAGLILTGLLALYVGNKLKAKPDTGFGSVVVYAAMALMAGTAIASDLGQAVLTKVNTTEQRWAQSVNSDSSCPEAGELADVIEVTEGQRVTVKKSCPLYLDQRQFANTGFILDAVEEKFRQYKPGQLINTSQNFPGVEKYPACFIDNKKVVHGSRCHMAQVTAVDWTYSELGIEEVHFIVRKAKKGEITPRLTL